MCCAYWTLIADVKCPKCGEIREQELQTHWMGEDGSCVNFYRMREEVPELSGIEAATLDKQDEFIGDCPNCKATTFYGAKIRDGRVVEVWGKEKSTWQANEP